MITLQPGKELYKERVGIFQGITDARRIAVMETNRRLKKYLR